MNQREFYHAPKSSWFIRLFWKAAGADRFLLERSTYGDQIKYMCLGGIIVATGLMAGLAGGYAFYTIFEPKGGVFENYVMQVYHVGKDQVTQYHEIIHTPTAIKAVVFGIIWGLIIFNIDRFIITSTGKGDGTEDITRKELKGALPRIIMGAIIALTISKPVEIRMFKTEIDVALSQEQDSVKNVFINNKEKIYESKVAEIKQKLGKINDDISTKESAILDLRQEISKEITGKNGNGAAYGPRAKELERQANILQDQIDVLKNTSEYKSAAAELQRQEDLKKKAMQEAEQMGASLDGLLERIKLAHITAGWVISMFITLLFMVIELTPIFFKLMLIKGPYDYLEENIKELIKAENGIEIEHNYYPDKQGIERDRITQHQVIQLLKEKILILESQSELNGKAIRAWKEKKFEEVVKNPEKYVSEENTTVKNG